MARHRVLLTVGEARGKWLEELYEMEGREEESCESSAPRPESVASRGAREEYSRRQLMSLTSDLFPLDWRAPAKDEQARRLHATRAAPAMPTFPPVVAAASL